MTKTQKYLLGNNPKLYGSIIGFNRGWRKNKPDFLDYYSFLLYFSHETGRIERYFYNSGNKMNDLFNNIPENEEYNKFKVNIEQNIKNKNTLNKFINLDNINIINLHLHNISFDNLYDGKLNSNMFNMFIFELIRDYFLYKQSYIICDMKFLRKYTEAKYIVENKLLKLGTGQSIYKNEVINDFSANYTNSKENFDKFIKIFISGLTEFYPTRFINFNNLKLEINVPKNFNNKTFNNILNKLDYDIINLDRNNEPQCIKELKTYINSRNILNYSDLSYKIMKWNNIVNKKLNKLDEND
jgi:hypothetical protein